MTRGRRTEGRAGCMPHGTETTKLSVISGGAGACLSQSHPFQNGLTALTECVPHNTDRVRVCHNLVLVSIQYSYSRAPTRRLETEPVRHAPWSC